MMSSKEDSTERTEEHEHEETGHPSSIQPFEHGGAEDTVSEASTRYDDTTRCQTIHTRNPYPMFLESMKIMVASERLNANNNVELVELLKKYIDANRSSHHGAIVRAFIELRSWIKDMDCSGPGLELQETWPGTHSELWETWSGPRSELWRPVQFEGAWLFVKGMKGDWFDILSLLYFGFIRGFVSKSPIRVVGSFNLHDKMTYVSLEDVPRKPSKPEYPRTDDNRRWLTVKAAAANSGIDRTTSGVSGGCQRQRWLSVMVVPSYGGQTAV
ncbi:hypothetical protein L1987_46163 [Smallanthus sonchifolius]|uniref:Uncharacterized protein n=1 Tax=Smallanthus sonchifolius TaxID=185202 RepID=A0ACB9FYQ0_9ASTR|nr:hypothetical protein L1987_46163 [Smallanthus sonchifolius]